MNPSELSVPNDVFSLCDKVVWRKILDYFKVAYRYVVIF